VWDRGGGSNDESGGAAGRAPKDRGAEGAEWGRVSNGEGSVEGAVPLPRKFFKFLYRYAAFWMQSDAFSDITRPVPNSLHSQPAENLDIIKPASANWVRDAGHFKRFFTGEEKRLKGQDVRVTGGIAFGRDSDNQRYKTAGPGVRIRGHSQYNRPTFCCICCRSTTI